MRDALRDRTTQFRWLDAAQLVKHAFGLVTEGRRVGKSPVLLYLFAEPPTRSTVVIGAADHADHRREVAEFADAVAGTAVRFSFCSFREWLATWPALTSAHAAAIVTRYRP